MKRTLTVAAIGLVACGLGGTAWAQASASAPVAEHKTVAPDEIKWGDAPPILQKGAKLAVLFGDPSKDGLFIVRLKMPANYKVMPHTHPTTENVTVISGAFAIGMGDKLDPKTKVMPPGTFFSMPAGMHHFAFSTKETVVEVSAIGPFVVNYLNPDDDPSQATPTTAAAKK
jgi:quercetin dioxygenase-like cupin family protein